MKQIKKVLSLKIILLGFLTLFYQHSTFGMYKSYCTKEQKEILNFLKTEITHDKKTLVQQYKNLWKILRNEVNKTYTLPSEPPQNFQQLLLETEIMAHGLKMELYFLKYSDSPEANS